MEKLWKKHERGLRDYLDLLRWEARGGLLEEKDLAMHLACEMEHLGFDEFTAGEYAEEMVGGLR